MEKSCSVAIYYNQKKNIQPYAARLSEKFMAKYLITYKCGHEVTKQLYGKIKERESYISWAEEQLCPECQHKMRHDEALADAETNGYPQLDGSEKQVA